MASGPNSPCDAAPPARDRRRDEGRERRSAGGWLLIAAMALLGVFYLHVLKTAATPNVDEAFRRTFITREFGAYPLSPVYEGRNGLGYQVGTRVVFDTERTRLLLSRFDWTGYDAIGPYLESFHGRLFFHVTNAADIAGRPLMLRLTIDCAMPEGTSAHLAITANRHELGVVPCGRGRIEPVFALPPGAIGTRPYDRITLTRAPATLAERVLTRLGLRHDAVALRAMEIAPVP